MSNLSVTLPAEDLSWLRDHAATTSRTPSEVIADLVSWERRWDGWVTRTAAQARKDDYDTQIELAQGRDVP